MTLLHILILLSAARAGSSAMMRLGQPPVLGELLGGMVLGPSFFGRLFPSRFQALFAPGQLTVVGLLAQAAMAAFLFYTGLEAELPRLRKMGRQALTVSAFGLALPFASGYGLGLCVPAFLIGPSADRTMFALFTGTAISISAIPVIARILMDLKLFHSDLGAVILSAATVDDVVGWSLLAVLLRGRGSHLGSWIGACALASGALLGRLGAVARRREVVKRVVLSWLAPLFFAYAGLKVDLSGLGGFRLPLLFIGAACASKIAGCFWGARLAGMERRESLAVGLGMNARGAMELVVASLGLGLGILNGASYSLIVLVAAVTTAMTPPLLKRACRSFAEARGQAPLCRDPSRP